MLFAIVMRDFDCPAEGKQRQNLARLDRQVGAVKNSRGAIADSIIGKDEPKLAILASLDAFAAVKAIDEQQQFNNWKVARLGWVKTG